METCDTLKARRFALCYVVAETGLQILEFYGMAHDYTREIWICVLALVVILCFWALLGILVINKVRHGNR